MKFPGSRYYIAVEGARCVLISEQIHLHRLEGLPQVVVEHEHGGVQVHGYELLCRRGAVLEAAVVSLRVDAGLARQLAGAGPVKNAKGKAIPDHQRSPGFFDFCCRSLFGIF